MPGTPQTARVPPQGGSLRREIIVILAFKLLALTALYFLFFDERPHITPGGVEHRILDSSTPAGPAHD